MFIIAIFFATSHAEAQGISPTIHPDPNDNIKNNPEKADRGPDQRRLLTRRRTTNGITFLHVRTSGTCDTTEFNSQNPQTDTKYYATEKSMCNKVSAMLRPGAERNPCPNDDPCLQARPSWGTSYTCTKSTQWCTGTWAKDMIDCCPSACDVCAYQNNAKDVDTESLPSKCVWDEFESLLYNTDGADGPGTCEDTDKNENGGQITGRFSHTCVHINQDTSKCGSPTQAGSHDKNDFVAHEMCCGCGGGSTGTQCSPESPCLCLQPCNAGSFGSPDATDCVTCHGGRASNQVGLVHGGAASLACTACVAGTFRASDDPDSTTCDDCPPGFYQDQDTQTSCKSCDPGFYNDKNSGSIAANACEECVKGQYESASGSIGCTPCASGMYTDLTGQTACTVCGVGRYEDRQGQNMCKEVSCIGRLFVVKGVLLMLYSSFVDLFLFLLQCPLGTFNTDTDGIVTKHDDVNDCVGCTKGQYVSGAGSTSCVRIS